MEIISVSALAASQYSSCAGRDGQRTGKVNQIIEFWIVYQFGFQEPGFVTPAFAGVQIHSLFRHSNGFWLAPE